MRMLLGLLGPDGAVSFFVLCVCLLAFLFSFSLFANGLLAQDRAAEFGGWDGIGRERRICLMRVLSGSICSGGGIYLPSSAALSVGWTKTNSLASDEVGFGI